jgi:hypothetical protein
VSGPTSFRTRPALAGTTLTAIWKAHDHAGFSGNQPGRALVRVFDAEIAGTAAIRSPSPSSSEPVTTEATGYAEPLRPSVALEIVDLPDPHPGPGQVRIATHAAGISATDPKLRAGTLRFGAQLPQTTGRDVARPSWPC